MQILYVNLILYLRPFALRRYRGRYIIQNKSVLEVTAIGIRGKSRTLIAVHQRVGFASKGFLFHYKIVQLCLYTFGSVRGQIL